MNTKTIPWVIFGGAACIAILAMLVAMTSHTLPSVSTSSVSYDMGPGMMDEYYSYGDGMMADSTTSNRVATTMMSEPMPPMEDSGTAAGEDIIKTGSLTIRVNSIDQGIADLDTIATRYNGTVLNRSVNTVEDQTNGYATLRVESARFEDAIRDIKQIATLVENEDVSTQDVTATVVDLEARLATAQAEEQSYLAVLDKATSVEDILKVQNYLSQVRSTIESYQSQLDYYASKTSYSYIYVSMTEESAVQFHSEAFRPLNAIIDAAQTVVRLAQSFIITLIYIIIVGGAVLLPLALIAFFAKKAVGGKKMKKK